MTVYGWSKSPWGTSWGGATDRTTALPALPTTEVWTLYSAAAEVTSALLDYMDVSAIGDASQFYYGSLHVASGGAFPAEEATLYIQRSTPAQFTFEARVKLPEVPPVAANLQTAHIYLGASDSSGSVAGVLLTSTGLYYTGSVHVDSEGALHPHFPLVQITGTLVAEGGEYVLRIVAVPAESKTYVYWTEASVYDEYAKHQLVAVEPLLKAEDSVYPGMVVDGTIISVLGSTAGQDLELKELRYSDRVLIPNYPPRAIAGDDQAVRACSIMQLDGSASYDVDGGTLQQYDWRLIDAPPTSQYVTVCHDGVPIEDGTGDLTTSTLTSAELSVMDDSVVRVGDVVLVDKVPCTVAQIQKSPYRIRVQSSSIPKSLSSSTFKVLRQDGVSAVADAPALRTFYPDTPGYYSFDLRVFDGALWSTIDGSDRPTLLTTVASSDVAHGVVPDMSFLFGYFTNFYRLVEDKDPIPVVWSGMVQVLGSTLLTLWQHQYGRSHRDIPRYFCRKWLHYDLLLGEPRPDLTSTKYVCYVIDAVSNLRGGDSLVLNSTAFGGPLVFSVTDTLSVDVLAHNLDIVLKLRNPGFSCIVAGGKLRIVGAVPFSVSLASVCEAFTPGTKATNPKLVGSTVGSPRVLVTSTPLDGLGIVENDLVCVGGAAARVSCLLSPTSILLKDDLPELSGTFVVSGWVSSKFINYYLGLLADGDSAYLVVSTDDGANLVEHKVRGVCAGSQSVMAVDLADAQAMAYAGASVRVARLLRRSYLPVDPLVHEVPMLQEHIVETDDSAVLHQNVDYYLHTVRGVPCIEFAPPQVVVRDSVSITLDVFEDNPPNRLWAEYTWLDNSQTIEDNFGRPVGLLRDDLARSGTQVDYLSAVRGMWHAYFSPPSLTALKEGMQILLGLPFSEKTGVIQEVKSDFFGSQTRVLVADTDSSIVRSYTFDKRLSLEKNPVTGEAYKAGDTIQEFAPLAHGVDVVDDGQEPGWWKKYVAQGALQITDKYHKSLVRVDAKVFSASALGLAKSWMLKMRPQTALPLFLVYNDVTSPLDEISIEDDVRSRVSLKLFSSVGYQGSSISGIFDQPNPAGGGSANMFDSDGRTPFRAYGVSDVPQWGFDRSWQVPYEKLRVTQFFSGGSAYLWAPASTPSSVDTEHLLKSITTTGTVGADTIKVRVSLLGSTESSSDVYLLSVCDGSGSTVVLEDEELIHGFNVTTELAIRQDIPVGTVLTVWLRRADGAAFAPPWSSFDGSVRYPSLDGTACKDWQYV